ncbi:hypothetical protein TNCV_310741 [Trichonephila clavipes]|nr:hypothetical protein TNCV_310741 [Trichonephila clavipes]
MFLCDIDLQDEEFLEEESTIDMGPAEASVIAGINAWILYKQTTGENISRQEFLLKLAVELGADFREAHEQPKQRRCLSLLQMLINVRDEVREKMVNIKSDHLTRYGRNRHLLSVGMISVNKPWPISFLFASLQIKNYSQLSLWFCWGR